MTWEEYQMMQAATNRKTTASGYWVKTDAECPECGGPIYKNIGIILACYPAKYNYECWDCHWTDIGE